MSLVWVIYLIDVVCGAKYILPSFGPVAALLIFLWGIAGLVLLIIADTTADYNTKTSTKYLELVSKLKSFIKVGKVCSVLFLLFALFSSGIKTFIPERDTAYKMLAAYGVEEAIKLPQVQGVADKSFQVLNKAMDDYLKESDKDKKDSKE